MSKIKEYEIEWTEHYYNPKEHIWMEAYDPETRIIQAKSAQEAFYKLADDEPEFSENFLKKAWENKNRSDKEVYHDIGDTGEIQQTGFLTNARWVNDEEGESDKKYLTRYMFNIARRDYNALYEDEKRSNRKRARA